MNAARPRWEPFALAAVLISGVAIPSRLVWERPDRLVSGILRAPGGAADALRLAVAVFAITLCVGWGGSLGRRLREPIGLRAVLLFLALAPLFLLGSMLVARLFGWAAPLSYLGLYGLLLFGGERLARRVRNGADPRQLAEPGRPLP